MADYTKINMLKDVESSSPDPENSQFRFARKYLNSRDIGVSLFQYQPNYHPPHAHSHKVQEEVYVVVKGSGRMLLDGKAIALQLWDVVRVAPKVVRAFEAGPDGLDLLIAGGPKPAEGDGVLTEPDWPD